MKGLIGALALLASVLQSAPAAPSAADAIVSARSAYLQRHLSEAARLLTVARIGVQQAPRQAIPHPKRTKHVPARFPIEAQTAGISGVVAVDVDVDPKGKVHDVRVTQSIKGLDTAALAAVKQWRYAPTIVNGTPVSVTTAAAINFTFRTDPMPLEQMDLAQFYEAQRQYEDAETALTHALEAIQLEMTGPGRAPMAGMNGEPPTILEPHALLKTPPVYPRAAIAAGVSGVVLVQAVIDKNGNVVFARVAKSVPMLDQAAINAVRTWRYEPARVNGEVVEVMFTVNVIFKLQAR